MRELNFLSAVSIAEKIRRSQLSPVEVIESHLSRIEKLDAKLNAFVQLDAESARRQARMAEAAVNRGEPLGPLHGIPLSIKSSIEVTGLRCESGSKLRAGLVAAQDAPLVTRLRQAGAIILGVTNAPELLMAWETDNLLYGRTNSPWDFSRTPGGSSGSAGSRSGGTGGAATGVGGARAGTGGATMTSGGSGLGGGWPCVPGGGVGAAQCTLDVAADPRCRPPGRRA